jgi:adenine deaminase
MKVSGQLVDIHNRDIYPAIIYLENERIKRIERVEKAAAVFILPGLIDAHIHIESSMVTPGAFALTAVTHGTIGVISDPHEIANIMGETGVHFMINDGERVPLKFWFGAPSCVPATAFESSGAVLNHLDVNKLLKRSEILYLSEMMNYHGVVFKDKEVLKKIETAIMLGKPIDGHAPGLSGEMLRKYVAAGISTDHECSTLEEAKEKIEVGMKILMREGSAARNLSSLKDLYNTDADRLMLCSDDLHPEMLLKRHINKLIAGLISEGYNLFDVIRSATSNPVNHYGVDAGLLRIGDKADFIKVKSLKRMDVSETWIDGKKVFSDGKVLFSYKSGRAINNFTCNKIENRDISVSNNEEKIRIIEAFDGELLTGELIDTSGKKNIIEPDTKKDVLKIIVKDRYNDSPPAVGFIKGFRLKAGAFASSIAHDSHNIICVGANDHDIIEAVNEIVRIKGGLAVSSGGKILSLRLNIGGIMSSRSCKEIAHDYETLNNKVKKLGCTMTAPFMTLSFMALLVIPDLKIGDKGLFDVRKFELVPLFVKKQQVI